MELKKMASPRPPQLLCSILLLLFPLASVAGENPFSPRAHLIRYWNYKISNTPCSPFLLSKASPLSASDSASFSLLASNHAAFSSHLASLCSKANLLCFPDPSPDLSNHPSDAHFSTYLDQNFTNYGTHHAGGFDSFKNYSAGESNIQVIDTFRRYGRDSSGHSDQFSSYGPDDNFPTQVFNTYGTGATDGAGQFKHYADGVNFADLKFTSYSANGDGRQQSFSTYSTDGNAGGQNFAGYGKDGNDQLNTFTNYGNSSNSIASDFASYSSSATGDVGRFTSYGSSGNDPDLRFKSYSADGKETQQAFTSYSSDSNAGDANFANYGKHGNDLSNTFTNYGNQSNSVVLGFSSYSQSGSGGNDSFTSYGDGQTLPENTFKNYADRGSNIAESFSSYRDKATVGDDSFQSYAKKSDTAEVKFSNYGNSFSEGTDKFSGYGKGAKSHTTTVDFKEYRLNYTFKDYAKDGVTFSNYTTTSSIQGNRHGKAVSRWVEPGKFFREEKLKTGTVMAMPDIKDKMPGRSFLPRSILSKLPFSSSKIAEMKEIFHAFDNSSMESMLNAALKECERAPSPGETKRCVGSAEDMIDFAVLVLGDSVELRTTESTQGSKQDIMIGEVKGVNGGRVTHSVSCHQSLYPYLLYYCHSVPKVRVYEADILDPNTEKRINHGVAICHLDTSSWSATHGAFLALGSGPGKIEVCHWIFENDLTWTLAD